MPAIIGGPFKINENTLRRDQKEKVLGVIALNLVQ